MPNPIPIQQRNTAPLPGEAPAPTRPAGEDHLITWARAFIYVWAIAWFSLVSADPDLWGHVHFGKAIVEQGAVHDTNPYSYTAEGYRWINHEWLMEVIFYGIYAVADSTGLILAKLFLGIYIIHLLSGQHFARSRNVTVYLGLFVLAVPAMSAGFMTRPHLATFLFLTWMVVVLQKFFDGNHHAIRWMPLIFLGWVNSHGGVVAGLGIFGLITFIEVVRGWKSGTRAPRLLAGAFALSCVAALIHPHSYKLWMFFYESLGRERVITEWMPVPLWTADYIHYKILATLFVLSWFLPTKKRFWELAVLTVALVYGFKHQRHTVLAVILLLPYLSMQYGHVLARLDVRPHYVRLSNHFQWTTQGVLLTFMIFFLINRWQLFSGNNYKIWVEPSVYPTYAARFMQTNHLSGNTAVPFDWGEYWIWKFPQAKVSIDGRFRTAYPQSVIDLNAAFATGRPEGKRLLTDFPTEFVLTGRHEAAHQAMESQPGWVKIYQDPISKIFVKETEPPSPALEKHQKGKLTDPTSPVPYEFPG
ncbi:hypothetical protein [Nitrospina gracilis]|uniref:hypothetical protein n=1 Tax=Nitrospina gracilis TaxID=35801 RepID=UPI001F3E80FC|nr:hypothetical protein [Nitrospina gracilis]MCF8719159.1 hypothetical protein [Nitrospina gracilis Nb-211]